MKLEEFLKGKQIIAVVCNQWGDSGKGKLVDFLSEWADVVVRGTGGGNAGHTVVLGDKTYIFHLIPCGITRDADGKLNVIGNGVAFEPRAACEELDFLDKHQMTYNNLRIAYNAKLVLPQHLVLDRLGEYLSGKGKIGTTGRGIGPVYSDHVSRVGLTVNDMLNRGSFESKLEKNLRDKLTFLKQADIKVLRGIMQHDHLERGIFFDQKDIFDIDAIVERYMEYGERLKRFIDDVDGIVREARKEGKKILLEGAQGHLLSIDYGSYPYVTSSDCSIPGLAKGSGLSERDVDFVLGVVKAPYMTRVGGGPFPTELGGKKSEEWCDSHKKEDEEREYPDASVNESDEFRQGVAIRRVGGEYGATTGRPRRTGWLDLPLLRYSVQVNGRDIALTKLQILDGADRIKICDAYIYSGDDYQFGNRTIRKGDKLDVAIPDAGVLRNCTPVYREFPGWKTPTADIKEYDALPRKLRDVVEFIEQSAGVRARILSMGPDREQTILR
jgi:adenylosuccinate synthase